MMSTDSKISVKKKKTQKIPIECNLVFFSYIVSATKQTFASVENLVFQSFLFLPIYSI